MIPRRAFRLTLAAVMTLITAGSADARAHGTRAVVDVDNPHRKVAGGLAGRHVRTTTERVPVCADLPGSPTTRCREHVAVTVTVDEPPPAFSDTIRRFIAERNLTRSLAQGIKRDSARRWLEARPVMHYGIEPEPFVQVQLKREMLVLLARITGEGAIGRAATGVSPGSSIRVFAEAEQLEWSSARATFIQIEEFRGPNPLVTAMAAQAGFGALGGALFWGGLFGEKMLHGALGDALVIHPQAWPPGIQIKGSFDVP